jgi:hypothetical protein
MVNKRENGSGPEVDVVDVIIVLFYFLLSSLEKEMAWNGVMISSAATALTETVNKTPFPKYLAILWGSDVASGEVSAGETWGKESFETNISQKLNEKRARRLRELFCAPGRRRLKSARQGPRPSNHHHSPIFSSILFKECFSNCTWTRRTLTLRSMMEHTYFP